MRKLLRTRRGWVLCLIAALCVTPALAGRPSAAVSDGGFGPNNRPVYMVISLTPDFELVQVDKVNGKFANQCDELGSRLAIIQVGTYIAGFDIGDTLYEGLPLAQIPVDNLPIDPDTGFPQDPETLNQNQVTVIGSFCTYAQEIHFVSPDPAPILPEVQAAFFFASAQIATGIMNGDLSEFPTTAEFAHFIYENQSDSGADINDIQSALFATSMRLNCTQCSAEGELFPHTPSNRLFDFNFNFSTDDGDLELNVVLPISIAFKAVGNENPLNLGSEGNFPLSILTINRDDDGTAVNFDATNVDIASLALFGVVDLPGGGTAEVGPIYPTKDSLVDVDSDVDLDLKLHFDTDDLEAFVLLLGLEDDALMALHLVGTATVGTTVMSFEGTDTIRIVPPNK